MIDEPVIETARSRLAVELAELGLDVGDALLDELAHAARRHTHEGVLPGYGAIVLRPEGLVRSGMTAARTEFEDAERLRQLADGRSSFVERIGDDVSLWLSPAEVTEVDLVAACRAREADAVRLDVDGGLHLVTADRVWTRHRTQWRQRPTAATLAAHLAGVEPCPGDEAALRGLLDLAVHALGPRDVGATLVWLPDWDRRGCHRSLPAGGSTPLLPLTDRTLDGAVTNLLRQHDGAALVAPHGALWWVGAELEAAPGEDPAPAVGGMRHRSAARFSRLRPDTWVVVVSHDGPVAVYVGGRDLSPTLG